MYKKEFTAALQVALLVIGINVPDVMKVCTMMEPAVLLAHQTVNHALEVFVFLNAQINANLVSHQLLVHLAKLDTISRNGLACNADLAAHLVLHMIHAHPV